MGFNRSRQAGFSLIELSLAIAIGLSILAASFWMVRQQNAEARVQQSKMMLATIRTALAASRYKYGVYPPAASISANYGGGGQRLVANIATISEPVSGVSRVYDRTPSRPGGPEATGTIWGGWIYDADSGTITVNLNSADFPGDDPLLW